MEEYRGVEFVRKWVFCVDITVVGSGTDMTNKNRKKRNLSSQSGISPKDKKTRTGEDSTAVGMAEERIQLEGELGKVEEKQTGMADIENVSTKIDTLDGTMQALQHSLGFITSALDNVRLELREVKVELTRMKNIEQEVENLKVQNRTLKDKIVDLENYSRRDNLVITGIPESREEN